MATTQRRSAITPLVIMALDHLRLMSPTMEEDHLKKSLSGKTNFSRLARARAFVGYIKDTIRDRLSIGDTKTTFKQVALDIGMCAVDNFNKMVMEITKHTFPTYKKRGTCIGN